MGVNYVIPPVGVIDNTYDTKYDPNDPLIPSVVLIEYPKRTMNQGGLTVDLGTTD